MKHLDRDQEWREVYLTSATLRAVFVDQIERQHPVGAWRFGESSWLPFGAEVVLAPHEGEMWIWVPGHEPFVTDARNFRGDLDLIAWIIEERGLELGGFEEDRRPRSEVRHAMWELRTANDEHQTSKQLRAANQKRGRE